MIRRDDAPRDLLFGLLALQNGMVTRDQLIAAFGAWNAAPGKRLADLLAERGGLRPNTAPYSKPWSRPTSSSTAATPSGASPSST